MGVLPQSNAVLIAITRGGYSEDYDRVAGDSPIVWQGMVDAYVQRKFISTFGDQGELRRVMAVTLYLSEDLPLTLEPGDVLTYQAGDSDSPSVLAGRVQNSTNPAYLPQLPDYYKIALEEVNVP